uniref:Uncharacterized protein n=1 Tax=viral metagenome TaxID=1070528 RepID=A0A6M3J2C7_9ZZZZ
MAKEEMNFFDLVVDKVVNHIVEVQKVMHGKNQKPFQKEKLTEKEIEDLGV